MDNFEELKPAAFPVLVVDLRVHCCLQLVALIDVENLRQPLKVVDLQLMELEVDYEYEAMILM